ncbi:LysE family translocator [Robertkochia solimangrovi]|uniref:LysE family translocator n=1 Tax=Robertkochia solimangrovi TaxID=2213046 RepID=UPI00117BE550|nr:LysE family translocator [Robertkochia solimangrovi]TRZ43524.1 LysE family translocator [Robertkochia solimangrovi]
MGIENLMTFMITSFLFIMTPGIDTVFVLNKSIGQGRKSGIYATLGINSGVLTHTFLAAIGLSVLIAKSDFVVTLIKFLGSGYLIYLGFLKLKNKKDLFQPDHKKEIDNSKNDFWSGFLTNTLNPKVALFFLAFFPQFIQADQLENPIPFIVLGITYAIIGIMWFLILTVFASVFRQKLQDSPKSGVWINALSGLVFIILGIKIVMS